FHPRPSFLPRNRPDDATVDPMNGRLSPFGSKSKAGHNSCMDPPRRKPSGAPMIQARTPTAIRPHSGDAGGPHRSSARRQNRQIRVARPDTALRDHAMDLPAVVSLV